MKFNLNWETVTAIYGAALSTILLVIKIIENKPKLSVKIEFGRISNNTGSEWTQPQFTVKISNTSNKTITIYSVGVKLPKGDSFIFNGLVNFPLPYELKECNNCMACTDLVNLKKTLTDSGYSNKIKVFAVVTDGADRTYKSRKCLLDFDKLYKKWKINST